MALQTINPTQTAAWAKLQQHYNAIASTTMQELFQEDDSRVTKFNLKWNDFLLDYSKNRINQDTMQLLLELANQVGLKEAIASYFGGEIINQTENRAVLHTALRAKESEVIKVDGQNVMPEVYAVKKKIKVFTNLISIGC
jgi:glucose-6-phosphate isomerase